MANVPQLVKGRNGVEAQVCDSEAGLLLLCICKILSHVSSLGLSFSIYTVGMMVTAVLSHLWNSCEDAMLGQPWR